LLTFKEGHCPDYKHEACSTSVNYTPPMHDLRTNLAGVARAMQGVVSLYLFGSVAEGREHAESDVDVGVLLDRRTYPTDRDRFDCRLLLGTRLSDAARRTADVVILNDAPPHLARAIVTRGQRIFCANAALDHAFVRDAQLLAADVDPWLQRMRALKLTAGERK
jgi:predicted nucleotidyltransferase